MVKKTVNKFNLFIFSLYWFLKFAEGDFPVI